MLRKTQWSKNGLQNEKDRSYLHSLWVCKRALNEIREKEAVRSNLCRFYFYDEEVREWQKLTAWR